MNHPSTHSTSSSNPRFTYPHLSFATQTFATLSLMLSLALSFASAAPSQGYDATAVSARSEGAAQMFKRYDDARMTYYTVGLGTCGVTNTADQFVVALNADQYGNGGYCNDTITISYGGKSAQAQIVNDCPGCPEFALDLSEGLFEYFAPISTGEIYGDWFFN
ncbi:plant expansin [Hygrophoropsis aurantiaca]|uniref:Plant expansin n=1 Tax=Hygrophoropsis aurantiaca TaxID=72124 RepID=A0ACB8AA74_9AGAM|nr:plant expansin [Hygrophoropsis aurantiaca]